MNKRKRAYQMNWIVRFGQLEKVTTDKVLDIVAGYDEYKNNLLDIIFTTEYSTKHIINNIIEKLNSNSMTQEYFETEVQKINQNSEKRNKYYNEALPKILEYIQNCCKEIVSTRNSMYDQINATLKSEKEYILMKKRKELYSRKLNNILFVFELGNLDELDIIRENYADLLVINEIAEKKNQEYDERQNELLKKLKENQKKDYLKIFDYKEIVALAEKNEYTKVRQTGDHIIMQHNKTNKIVPIPAHELKYGLMLQIQKQITANKVG